MTGVQPHMRIEDEVPVPCGCALGYHHTPVGEPVWEFEDDGAWICRPGRHPYCVGACKVWNTPTEEFDFLLVRGKRVSERRIETGVKVVDHVNNGCTAVVWDNDSVSACTVLGMHRFFGWRARQRTS